MNLGDRMKLYEGLIGAAAMPGLPLVARLDGRAFHTFTRGLRRPYDERIHRLMAKTAKALVGEFHATLGYTQSDEISLVWVLGRDSELPFGGRAQKLCSILASFASAVFNDGRDVLLPGKGLASFDCRVFNVPSEDEAANYFLWRERDATKNSISMAAQSVYSHKELHRKNGNDMQEMLFQKGINWNDYPDWFKRGTFVRRVTVERLLTLGELENLPPKHEARAFPDKPVIRSAVVEFTLPSLGSVVNDVDVLLRGAEPVLKVD